MGWVVYFFCNTVYVFLPSRRYAIASTSHGRVSVCLSVTSRSSVETVERIELVFGIGSFFYPSYTELKGNSCI